MGKKGKKVDAEKKAALQARKEARQEKAARKRLSKQQKRNSSSVGDPDESHLIDEVLHAYKNHEGKVTKIEKPTMESLAHRFPLPRANATFECVADEKSKNRGHFYLFGGEYFDGLETVVLDELLRFDIQKKEWKEILTPAPRPNPRCAHSCVSYKSCLYVFGGETSSSDQYHHYRDFWKFDIHKKEWEEIKAKNPPSARSGMGCMVWKHYMILFGGFFEALRETKFYQDVHVFNLQTETWMDCCSQSRLALKPNARSGSNLALFGDNIVVHGGYSKIKSPNTVAETKTHTDAWVLHLSPILQEKPPTWVSCSSSKYHYHSFCSSNVHSFALLFST